MPKGVSINQQCGKLEPVVYRRKQIFVYTFIYVDL